MGSWPGTPKSEMLSAFLCFMNSPIHPGSASDEPINRNGDFFRIPPPSCSHAPRRRTLRRFTEKRALSAILFVCSSEAQPGWIGEVMKHRMRMSNGSMCLDA